MFSVAQKRAIANAVQKILRDTGHPELPKGEIAFRLSVHGAEEWSWAEIMNNGSVLNPTINPHNEAQEARSTPPPCPKCGEEVPCIPCERDDSPTSSQFQLGKQPDSKKPVRA